MLRMAKTFLKDQAMAEDLTHDVFERLWRGNQFQERFLAELLANDDALDGT